MTYAPLVKYIVFKKVRELPARCEVEDFISCGLEALIASIDRYDPEKGATLEQFAWTRIHGAVLDELRRQDWAPRSLRRWERDIHKAREQFTSLHGRRPSREELAEMLAITAEELRRRQDDIAVSDVTSLNTLVISDDETTVERIDTLADGDAASTPSRPPPPRPPRTSSAAPSTLLPAARARGRRPALRQEPHAARDRRHPRRVREPRLPDPLAAQAHPAPAARPTTRCSSRAVGGEPLKSRRRRPITTVTMTFEIGQLTFRRPPPAPAAPARAPEPRPSARAEPVRGRRRRRDPREPAARGAGRGGRAPARARASWRAQNRELHFRRDEVTGRTIIEVRTLEGEVLRTIPPSKMLDVMSRRGALAMAGVALTGSPRASTPRRSSSS